MSQSEDENSNQSEENNSDHALSDEIEDTDSGRTDHEGNEESEEITDGDDDYQGEEEEECEEEEEQDGEDDDVDKIDDDAKGTTKKVDDNDDDLTPSEVHQFIKIGSLYAGPPSNKKYHSRAWTEGGMRFLYWSENDEELENWYHCSVCEWTHKVILAGGTNVIKNHAEKHLYQLQKDQLVQLLVQATLFGKEYGSVSVQTFTDHLPSSDQW